MKQVSGYVVNLVGLTERRVAFWDASLGTTTRGHVSWCSIHSYASSTSAWLVFTVNIEKKSKSLTGVCVKRSLRP